MTKMKSTKNIIENNIKITSGELNNIPRKVTKFNIAFINIQLFLTFFTLGLFIWYIIDSDMIYSFQLFLGLTLLVMAYNNQFIYRSKKMTAVYASVGFILLILDLIMYIGVHFIGV